jgi:hypothetical protein
VNCHWCTALFLVALLPAAANAQGDCFSVDSNNSVSGPGLTAGVGLALGDCSDVGGHFAAANCSTNTGIALPLVVSVVAPPGIDRMVGCEIHLDVITDGALSDWWMLDGCRAGALSFDFDFLAGPYTCNDFWQGQAVGGGGVYPPWLPGPNRFRITLVCATRDEHPIAPDVEHYVASVRITRAKSTGAGACAGCGQGACIALSRVVLNQPAGVGDCILTHPIGSTWPIVQYANGASVPTQNRTWGQVKALYR